MNRQISTIILLGLLSIALAICCAFLYIQKSKRLAEEEEPIVFCATEDPSEQNRANSIGRGEAFFKAKCATCHMIQKNSTGSALAGCFDKKGNFDLFDAYLKNSDSIRKLYKLPKSKYSFIDFNHEFKELDVQNLKDLKLYILIEE